MHAFGDTVRPVGSSGCANDQQWILQVTEMSEASLDKVISAVTALKAVRLCL
jgi:hypothetical protein